MEIPVDPNTYTTQTHRKELLLTLISKDKQIQKYSLKTNGN